ncbi:serine-rich adhesin for platelets isoform X2 [Drosophila kikkawai]|uniref:Serine-rich adhesin for platelets isoform X2 n=1 Tax=Drosophila kikkawai TaxID=30033 RepID=A0A6P4ID85_DROKI|nr:uncharacterized protein LOC108073395 isoform X3 [Drosophila kikkawai]
MERASSEEPGCSRTEARNLILEVARSRPGTNVSRCIETYEEQQDLDSLVNLLEEVSKNTDYSTDLRISMGYYGDDFLRHSLADNDVTRRAALLAAGRTIHFSGKIYGDRVEYVYQGVEHQVDSLLISQVQREPAGESNGPENTAPKPEEPRKRRAKKLTKKDVDPYMLTMEPRRFKTMSDDKRFNTTGFVKCMKNRTIEYLYQDHMPPNLWRHAPIVDPQNPLDQDEKKQYKMFTYHVEHRYNTLLPDIPFERLNLIKEYVHTNQMNTSEILNEHMTTKDYLEECIALENKMLASRYGATVRTRRRMDDQGKRLLDVSSETSLAKRTRLEEDQALEPNEAGLTEAMDVDQSTLGDINESTGEALQNQVSIDSGFGESMNLTQQNSGIDSTLGVSQTVDDSLSVSQVEDSSLSVSQVADSAIGISQGENSSQVENSSLSISQEENGSLSVSQVENPPLSSTLALNESSTFAINESNVLDSTRLDFPPVTEAELLQIDFGIGMDDVSDSHHTDFEDQKQRRQFETAVIDKNAVMTDLNEIKVEAQPPEETEGTAPIIVMHAEEPVNVPREVCYPIVMNMFGFPNKHVRRKCFFKLPKEYDTFKKARLPSKRGAEPKTQPTPRALVLPSKRIQENQEDGPASPVSVEFDMDMNFLGYRRPTMDSGFALDEVQNQSRTLTPEVKNEVDSSGNPVNGNGPSETANPEAPIDIPSVDPVEGNAPSEAANPEALIETIEAVVSETINSELNATTEPSSEDITENSEIGCGLEGTLNTRIDSGLGAELNATDGAQLDQTTLEITTLLEKSTIIDEAPANDDDGIEEGVSQDIDDETSLDIENADFTDSSTMIRDWHMRLAPTLEAAHARQNFNIKDLGTEILNVCKAGDNGQATLADVMADKDPSIMCRYMLASLVLTNHGNVSLDFGNRDKSKPIEMSQFCMQLKSTKRQEIHPEDDVGNMSAAAAPAAEDKSKPAKRKSSEVASPEVFAKTVRLIQSVPKMSQSAYDTDSGISSMCSSLASASQEV